MKNLKLTSLLLLTITFFSCSNDDSSAPINEEEVITTINVTLVNGSNTITLQSKDLDGDGPNAPVITVSDDLATNTTYLGSVKFLNELENPAEDITEEVEEEGVDHQLFYQLTNSLGTFSYADLDNNGKPIGLEFTLTTNNVGTGTLTITLRHQPNKSNPNVSNGDITNAGGNTDAEVSFPLTIQ